MKRIPHIGGRVLACGALVLLLTGCLKLDMRLTVSSGDTVGGSMIFGVDKKLLQATGQSVGDLTQGGSPFSSDVQGVRTEPYEDDTFIGQRYTFEDVPLSQFGSGGEGELKIVREGDRFTVSGVLDLSQPSDTGGADLGEFQGVVQQAFKSADIRIAITFPGEVVSSNGEISGTTVTWTPRFGEKTTIEAVAKAEGGGAGSSAGLIIGAIVGLGAVLAVIAVAVGRRGRRAPEAAPPSPPTPPPPPTPIE